MKRLLALLLALTMTVYAAPLSALAASEDSFHPAITVESEPDADLAQAIASDPFLTPQADSASQQEQETTVDTSNVSMEATNSFGQLLLDSMEEENGTEYSDGNRIVDISLNGSTATVQYRAEEDADLVVGIYTDTTEQTMIASGTAEAAATTDGTIEVAITGETLPEFYVVKGYLLDKSEHAPLCKAFTDTSRTEAVVDIKNATTTDFEEDRVIDFDGDSSTNFAVVKPDVTLLTTKDATAGQNQVTQQDNDNHIYTIANASDTVKNLQPGDIFTYEYASGEMLIVKVDHTDVSGDTVTIYGQSDLELTDVFDALKIETDNDTTDFTFDTEDGFTDNGEVVLDDSLFEGDSFAADTTEDPSLDETNGWEWTKPVEDTKDANIGRNWNLDKTFSGGINVTGEVAISATATLTYYISLGKQVVDFSLVPKAVANLTISASLSKSFNLPGFGVSPVPGVYVGCKPQINVRASVDGSFTALATTKIGASYDSSKATGSRFENTSTLPTFKFEANIQGTVYVGIDFGPELNILGGAVATIKVTAEIGATATIKARAELVAGGGANPSHGCKLCFSITLEANLNIQVALEFLFEKVEAAKSNFSPLHNELGRYYWSPEYHDFGRGDCPHTTPKDPDPEPEEPDEPLDADIPTGGTAIATGACGDNGKNPIWTLDDNGVLTISGTGKMSDYSSYNSVAPWRDSQYIDQIKYIVVEKGVTGIGNYAFYNCKNVTNAAIAGSVTSIGNYAFNGCTSLSKLTLTQGIISIGDYAFSGCTDLSRIVIPASVVTIGGNAFNNCTGLISVDMSNGVTTIGSSAFASCTSLTSIVIPSSVTQINSYAFSGCASLVSVSMQEGLLSIGNDAFQRCTVLTSITIPDSVTSIGSEAFYGSGLTSITIPGSVTSIGSGAFQNCKSLTNAVLEKGVKNISNNMFWGCSSLTNVVIPEGVTSIGGSSSYSYGAFYDCTSLTSITIPSSVTSIGGYAFGGCTALTSVTISEGVTSIGTYAFSGCKALTEVVIPASVKTVGTSAFSGCSGLTYVKISDGVNTIGSDAFSGCTSLTTISIPASIAQLNNAAFSGCTSLTSVIIQDGAPSIGAYAFSNCESLTHVTIPNSVTSIGNDAFQRCTALTSITIPNSVTSIGSEAFYGCGLISVTIPGSVASIGSGAFQNCKSLRSALLEKGVKSVSNNMFWGCSSLTNVVIPEGVTSIGGSSSYSYGAFYDCTSLTSITVPATVTSIGGYAFGGCTALTSVTISEGVTSIGSYAFSGCKALTEVVIPASVKTVGTSAFSGCSGLTHVEISDGVNAIGTDAFNGCTSLTTISIPASITQLNNAAFSGCTSLTNVIIQEGAPSIGAYAFSNCESLTHVTIPKSVTSIGNDAFQRCTALTSITIPDSVTTIGSEAFYGCGLTSATVPGSVTTVGSGAFQNCKNLRSAVLEKGVKSISNNMFRDCVSLTSVTIPEGVTSIGGGVNYSYGAFENCTSLTSITIPASVTSIGGYAFDSCSNLTSVKFNGTQAQWQAITLGTGNDPLTQNTIQCADGSIAPSTENTIADGNATETDGVQYAVFNGLTAGADYTVIVSRAKEDALAADNLVYINQKTVGTDGVLVVPFRTTAGAEEMVYVVACTDEEAPVNPDPEPTPGDDDKPSSDGGGGGAGVAIAAVAVLGAAAVTVGVVMMMPVEVSGVVKLSDNTVPANATVQLVKNGQLVAQTTTDAAGHFTASVKRGDYQMNVITVDPATGASISHTTTIKAPAKNATFVFL